MDFQLASRSAGITPSGLAGNAIEEALLFLYFPLDKD
jgi:hypothetical protein